MRMMRGLVVAMGLAGCVTETAEVADACGAGALQGLVGQPLAALDAVRVTGPLRVIAPGMAVTMDFRADRLNVEHDAARVITRISCG